MLFKELVAEKSKGKLILMGIEKLVNIWRPHSGSKLRINHAYNFWLNLIVLIHQVYKTIMF
jgi:hypothetical protein